MNVSRQAVSKWETGSSGPDIINLIKLADVLDSDVEYLATGRQTVLRRPPVVIKSVEYVDKIIEKPVIKYVEKIVEKKVPVVEYVDRPIIKEVPVIKKVLRKEYRRNTAEYAILAFVCFAAGLVIGLVL